VKREPRSERGVQRHAVGMEGEGGGAARDADVRGRERDDARELERGYDEQRAADRERHDGQPARRPDRRGDAARGEQAAGHDTAEEPEPDCVACAGGHERVHERPGAVAGAGVAERERAADQRPPARGRAGDGGGEAAAGEHELPGIRSAQRGEHRSHVRRRSAALQALRPDRHRPAPSL